MRIKKHVLAFFFLLSSAPFLWADESPPTIPHNTSDEAIDSSESGTLDGKEPMHEETPPNGDDAEQIDVSQKAYTQQNDDEISEQEEQYTQNQQNRQNKNIPTEYDIFAVIGKAQ